MSDIQEFNDSVSCPMCKQTVNLGELVSIVTRGSIDELSIVTGYQFPCGCELVGWTIQIVDLAYPQPHSRLTLTSPVDESGTVPQRALQGTWTFGKDPLTPRQIHDLLTQPKR